MESEEQLSSILFALDDFESRVLELDRMARSGEDYRPLVHVIFRLAHNLKGAFSVAGLEACVGLLHACESCLDSLRSSDAPLTGALADMLVSAVDELRGAVSGPAGEGLAELRLKLERENATLRSSKVEPRGIDFALDEEELGRLERGLAAGASCFLVEKLIGGGLDDAAAAGLPIFETVADAGTLVAWRIRRLEGGAAQEAVLLILFATALGIEDLSFIVFDPLFPISAGDAPRSRTALPAPQAAPRAAPPSPSSSALPRMLLVDDEALALILLQKSLGDYGRIDSASSGREALDRFSAALREARYSAVFLDVRLGDAHGTEVLREMRRLEGAAGIEVGRGAKIVMATAARDYETVSASFRSQCDLYLIKPIAAPKIHEAMAKLGIPRIG